MVEGQGREGTGGFFPGQDSGFFWFFSLEKVYV